MIKLYICKNRERERERERERSLFTSKNKYFLPLVSFGQ